jgi:AbrB family looped-hinge helix DNA binding protein
MTIVKATGKGQVVIPAKIRKRYHITKGTKVIIFDKDDQIILKPVLNDPVKEARGIFKKGASALKVLMDDRREDAKN